MRTARVRVVRVSWRDGHAGCRVWLLGRRAHHGAAGVLVLAAGVATGSELLIVIGLAAMCHDLADFPWTATRL